MTYAVRVWECDAGWRWSIIESEKNGGVLRCGSAESEERALHDVASIFEAWANDS